MAIAKDEVKTFTRQFCEMINEGKALVPGLSNLAQQQANPELQQVIRQIDSDIQGEYTLSRAMSKHPDVFDERYIVTVRYGEIYGILDETLKRLT